MLSESWRERQSKQSQSRCMADRYGITTRSLARPLCSPPSPSSPNALMKLKKRVQRRGKMKIKTKISQKHVLSTRKRKRKLKSKTHLFTPTPKALNDGPTKLDGKRRLRTSIWTSERLALTVAAILDALRRLRRICGCCAGRQFSLIWCKV